MPVPRHASIPARILLAAMTALSLHAADAAAAAQPMPAWAAKVALHNFAGAEPTADGSAIDLYRLPAAVRNALSERGQGRMQEAAHSEIRFVLNPGAKLEDVKLNLEPLKPQAGIAFFYGDYAHFVTAGTQNKKAEVRFPTHGAYTARMDMLPRSRFANQVCRIVLSGGPWRLHGVDGDIRPPQADELAPMMLSYGTSITQGARATRDDLGYNALTARQLGYDLLNLGCSGSAYCEPEIVEYMANLKWDLCVLELSVNMVKDYSVEQFRERTTHLIARLAESHPKAPIVCISLFPYFQDYEKGGAKEGKAKVDAYRSTLEEVCASSRRGNVHFVKGTDLMRTVAGLTQDVLHPSDQGMIEIAMELVPRIRAVLKP